MKDSHYKSMIAAMYATTLLGSLLCAYLEWSRIAQIDNPMLLTACIGGITVFFTGFIFLPFISLFIRSCVICFFPASLATIVTICLATDTWMGCTLLGVICCSALSRNIQVLSCAYFAAMVSIVFVIISHSFYPELIGEHTGTIISSRFTDIVSMFIFDIAVIHFVAFELYFLVISQNKQTVQLDEQRLIAEKAVKVKSDLFANLNHEIRTPLNAILASSSFLQSSALPPTAHEHIRSLRTASQTLSSIVNDVIDLAKIEAGMFDIVPIQYTTHLLVNDLVNTLSIRFIDKPIHFFLDIDPKLPQVLVGDEIRIRQIIINLISNALKFTKAGFVRLSMKGIQANDRLLLYVSVQDTGQGIKENDRKNLFGVFGPVDTRSTEGTGVGLAISRNFVQMMNGTIYVDTVWGKGSTFSFVVPQEFGTSRTPLVQINRNDEGQHRVAILETGHELSDQWAIPMRQLKIDFKITSKPIEFVTMLHTNNFSHYLIAEELYEKMKDDLSRVTVNLIIIIKQNTRINSDFELPYLRRPVYSQTLYTALNGGEINVESAACQKQFTAPTALILVVDNNEMNIKTAEGLLGCYGCQVIGASSGMEAIKTMQEQYVDLVMMDHMMPEMDGVETTKKIRALSGEYYDSVPIIAVTTNAIADGQEILREICYNDFLAKPIEPARLANVLIKWLPANKVITTKHQTENADVESPNVPQANANFSRGWDAKNPNTRSGSVKTFNLLDSRTGLRYVGNEKGMYLSLLIDFIAISSEILQKIMALYEAKDWKNYAIETHALKSIARTFGALPLSEASKEMEHASKEGNETLITEMFDHYVAVFTETVQHITDYVEANKNEKK